MAPIRKRQSIRSRAERSAKDPRGIYAPPLEPVDSSQVENVDPQPTGILKRSEASTELDESWRLNKKDKRTIKHNTLLNKVRDAGVQKSTTSKRRRPTKKLVAANGLNALADALPDLEDRTPDDDGDGWEGIEDDEVNQPTTTLDLGNLRKASRKRRVLSESAGKMVMKSSKSRPGAMKRKHKMELGEMERFRKNLAQMTGSATPSIDANLAGQSGATGQTLAAEGTSDQASRWKALRAFIGGTMQQDSAFSGRI